MSKQRRTKPGQEAAIVEETKAQPSGERLETLIPILIAVVSVITAIVVWRATMLRSDATDVERGGIIDTLKAEAAMSENLAYLYQQEADHARTHLLIQAQVNYLRQQAADFAAIEGAEAVAAVLNSEADALLLVDQGSTGAVPLVADPRYRREDGTFDLDARLADLTAEYPDLAALDPESQFAKADRSNDHALALGLAIIGFALALFALTLAQITKRRIRWLFLVVGVVLAAIAIAGVVGLEITAGQLA
jgi:hypothetical protein